MRPRTIGRGFTGESWRKVFVRNHERGAYKKIEKNEMRIVNTIFGKPAQQIIKHGCNRCRRWLIQRSDSA